MPSMGLDPSPSRPTYIPVRRRMCSRASKVWIAFSSYLTAVFGMVVLDVVYGTRGPALVFPFMVRRICGGRQVDAEVRRNEQSTTHAKPLRPASGGPPQRCYLLVCSVMENQFPHPSLNKASMP